MSDTPRHVVIVGGGISGLAAAYEIQAKARAEGLPITYTLLESGPRLGGKIITDYPDGFVIEGGPDSFLTQKPWAAELCRRLGLGADLMGTNPALRKTFVLNNRRLTPLPEGVMLIIPTRIMPFVTSPLISWPGKLRMGLDLLIPPRPGDDDESLASFIRRRFGQEALDKIAEPLLSGIHVSDPEWQSLLGTFPRFRQMEVEHGSLIRAMLARQRAARRANSHSPPAPPPSAFTSLRGGLTGMVAALERALTAGRVVTGAGVTHLARTAAGPYALTTAAGETLHADAVILATPAPVSARLLASLSPPLADLLGGIRHVSTATVSLGFRRADVTHPLDGYGFVIPRREGRQISACTWTSSKFTHRAAADMALLRVFIGGPHHEELVDWDDDALVGLALRELGDIMGLAAKPQVTRVFRWPKANPQYQVGHPARVRQMMALAAEQPGLFLCGCAFDGVGIPDCVRQGQETAAKALTQLTPTGAR